MSSSKQLSTTARITLPSIETIRSKLSKYSPETTHCLSTFKKYANYVCKLISVAVSVCCPVKVAE